MNRSFFTIFSKRLLTSALLLSSTLLMSTVVLSEEIPLEADNWNEQKKEGNITIYTRPHPNSSFKAFKAVAILNAPLSNIMAVMANPLSCIEWVHGCTESYGFDVKSFNDRYAYSVNDMPWPFKDRDYVIHIETTNKPESNKILMHMNASADKKEISDDYLRVSVAQTIYILEALDDNKTKMIWLQHVEPGGVLPGWLVNSLIVDIPIKSLQALEEVAQEEKYHNTHILFDKNGNISGVDSKPTSLK
jgi:START domain-containing protein